MRIPVLVGLALLAALAAAPWLLSATLINAAISMLIAALFATAYNLLCGQAGMLSFGHAAYFGIGAFATIHAMNAIGGAGLLPTPLMPFAGAVGGLLIGLLAGWFATQRSGAYFAMITLAIAELIHSLSPHLRDTFGGEAGLSSMRMPAWGFDFGSQIEVYYLTLAWVAACIFLLYLFTRTPLGRLTLGLRENSHRLRFLGYNVHYIGVLVFAISGMFSGIAGGLQVINNEAANYVVFDPAISAAVVLNTYIGGVHAFLGPALGAALMTFFGYAASDMTQSWLLYQGLLFVLVMMFMPTGLSGLVIHSVRYTKLHGAAAFSKLFIVYAVAVASLSAGIVLLTELTGRVFSQDYKFLAQAAGPAGAPPIQLFQHEWHPAAWSTWLIPAAAIVIGIVLWRCAQGISARQAERTQMLQESRSAS